MKTVRRTAEFANWLRKLKDARAIARIETRVTRLALGNRGDWKATSEAGIFELRLDYGPGYRLYYTERGDVVVVLLIGGDKSSQQRDIRKAAEIAANIED